MSSRGPVSAWNSMSAGQQNRYLRKLQWVNNRIGRVPNARKFIAFKCNKTTALVSQVLTETHHNVAVLDEAYKYVSKSLGEYLKEGYEGIMEDLTLAVQQAMSSYQAAEAELEIAQRAVVTAQANLTKAQAALETQKKERLREDAELLGMEFAEDEFDMTPEEMAETLELLHAEDASSEPRERDISGLRERK